MFNTGDKMYCIHMAPDEETVREHARRGGFPADRTVEITDTIDPSAASLSSQLAVRQHSAISAVPQGGLGGSLIPFSEDTSSHGDREDLARHCMRGTLILTVFIVWMCCVPFRTLYRLTNRGILCMSAESYQRPSCYNF